MRVMRAPCRASFQIQTFIFIFHSSILFPNTRNAIPLFVEDELALHWREYEALSPPHIFTCTQGQYTLPYDSYECEFDLPSAPALLVREGMGIVYLGNVRKGCSGIAWKR